MKKKIWILGLAMGLLLVLSVAQTAQAAPPGDGGDKNCIGYCEYMGYVPGNNADFARLHNPSIGGGCGMTDSIRDSAPPQP